MKPLTLGLLGCALLLCAVAGEIEIRAQDNNNNNVLPRPKMIGLPNAKPEHNPPSVSVAYPKDGQRVGESIIRTVITASDDARVESFHFSINGTSISGPQGDWYWAPGMPWRWGASIGLNPGTNTFAVQCG